MKKWKVLNSEKIIDNKWITVEKQKCYIGNGKTIDDYYIIKKKDYVVLIVEMNNKIFFVKQYRHGAGEIILNLPMGLIDERETAETAANRELYEEIGLETDELKYLGSFYKAPSYISTKVHVFYTNNVKNKSIDKKDPNEEMLITSISKEEIKKLIEKNDIKDMSTIAALFLANKKLNLF